MRKDSQFLMRLDAKLKTEAQTKSQRLFGIGLGTLVNLFLRSFVAQDNVGFYIGDDQFNDSLNNMLKGKKFGRFLREGRRVQKTGL